MDLLIGDVFRNAARSVPERTAAVLDGRALTFGELDAASSRTARVLVGAGVGRGDRVVVSTGTSLDVVPLFAALAKLGAVFAPANPSLSAREAAALAARAQPSLVVAGEDQAEAARTSGVPLLTLDELRTRAATAAAGDDGGVAIRERDPHVVFFTSGTTGVPKGVVLSHRVNHLRSQPGALLEPRGALVCPYPLFHMGAWTLALQQWQARGTVVLLAEAEAGAVCAAVERHGAERINCVPAVWRRVLDHLAGATLPTLRFADTGTSATPPELLGAIAGAAPAALVRVFYGSTEAGSVTMLEHDDIARKPGSCGVPGPGVSIRTTGDGELWVRSPVLFDGYFDDQDATAEVLVDGWYRTGDVAEVDGEGYVTIVGRSRDVIRTGGETVAPGEVEAVLAGHPSIADVAVVGVPDTTWGEIVCAVVVTRSGAGVAPDVDALRRHCEGRLARYKHPRRVTVVDAIPRTASTGQVQRRLLVEQLG